MKLKNDTDIASFLHAVSTCNGEVLFLTEQGDRLSLKSELSKYVFAVAAANPQILQLGQITLENQQDMALLVPYLTED